MSSTYLFLTEDSVFTLSSASGEFFFAPDPSSDRLIDYEAAILPNNDFNPYDKFDCSHQTIDTLEGFEDLENKNLSNQNFRMEEEISVSPSTARTLTSQSNQPGFIEIEDDSSVSEESARTNTFGPKNQNSQRNAGNTSQINFSNPNIVPDQKLSEGILIQSEEQSSDNSEREKKNLPHLRMERRQKGKRNHLQKVVKGYWTNNLLRWAKKYHYDCIVKNYGEKFFKTHPQVNKVFNKIGEKGKKMEGITMADYVTLYNERDLADMWREFFAHKILFRELMLSKTDPKLKVVYVIFLPNFERAFRTKKFDYLSRAGEDKSQNI